MVSLALSYRPFGTNHNKGFLLGQLRVSPTLRVCLTWSSHSATSCLHVQKAPAPILCRISSACRPQNKGGVGSYVHQSINFCFGSFPLPSCLLLVSQSWLARSRDLVQNKGKDHMKRRGRERTHKGRSPLLLPLFHTRRHHSSGLTEHLLFLETRFPS